MPKKEDQPEEKPEVKKKLCPNCNTELQIEGDNQAYCTGCDITYHLHKGKVAYEGGKKGKIQELEEDIAELRFEQQKIVKKLFGLEEGEKDLWMD